MFTSSVECQVSHHHVSSEEVLLVVLPHVGFVSHVTLEHTTILLVDKIEKPYPVMVEVGLEIKHIVDLMG